jgi:hypothetical protein
MPKVYISSEIKEGVHCLLAVSLDLSKVVSMTQDYLRKTGHAWIDTAGGSPYREGELHNYFCCTNGATGKDSNEYWDISVFERELD